MEQLHFDALLRSSMDPYLVDTKQRMSIGVPQHWTMSDSSPTEQQRLIDQTELCYLKLMIMK